MLWKTIITYLVDGSPFGVKMTQFSNRLIIGASIPRKDFPEVRGLKELERSGIYFLFGEDELWNPLAYIGQATVLSRRLNDHYKDTRKDFWNVAIAFTTKDGAFNESDINYLERELIREAKKAWRYEVKNENSGNNGLIQEYRIPDMMEYLEDLKVLLSWLGFPVLQELTSSVETKNENKIYFLKERGSDAKWVYTDEGFVVLKWSVWPKEMQKSVVEKRYYAFRNRPKLLDRWIIGEDSEKIIFLQDHLFSFPSSACDLVTWWSYNGWDVWKTEDWLSLNDVERKNEITQ